MNSILSLIIKIVLPRVLDLVIEAMQESSKESGNTVNDNDVNQMLENKDHLEKKIKVNLKSKGGGKLFKRR